MLRNFFNILLIVCFVCQSVPFAAGSTTLLSLPTPGAVINPSAPFMQPFLKGIRVFPEDPMRFDFIVDPGNTKKASDQLKGEAEKLIKYFLAALTIPDDDQWVNLSPYEKNRITTDALGHTALGRDLLAQDYILKQFTASLLDPESKVGADFWEKVHKEAYEKFGNINIPVDTFNKVWIVPGEVSIYEHDGSAVVVDSRLKVLMDEDYLAQKMGEQETSNDAKYKPSDVLRAVVIPVIEKEVNEGGNFAALRQAYQSVILATWYKRRLKGLLLSASYADQGKTHGIETDPSMPEKIYQRYLEAFRRGAINVVKEVQVPGQDDLVPQKYFSGGLQIVPKDIALIPGNAEADLVVSPVDPDGAMAIFNVKMHDMAMTPIEEVLSIFEEGVLKRVIGGDTLPADLHITTGQDEGGAYIRISHTAVEPLSGREVNFLYKVVISDQPVVRTFGPVDLDAENVIQVPDPSIAPWDEDALQVIRYAMRRLLVADPYNARFAGAYEMDPYQEEADTAIQEAFEEGKKAFVSMATATGKTVVAFTAMDRYFDRMRAEGKTPGKVVFIVNNTKILSEAEEKLQQMFPGKYTTSQVYEGSADYTGDVIFATSASLASGARMGDLLQNKISLVIFDEAHHVPADKLSSIYAAIDEQNMLHHWETSFLAMTATDVRPDRISVIGLFEKNVVFRYPIGQAELEGSLVPLEYKNVDDDLFFSPDAPAIRPGDPLWEDFRDERYATARFPLLFEAFQEEASKLLDKRGLVIAPNVAYARALAQDWTERGVEAVSMTSADRADNPELFEHQYIAWKTGKWPEGSPYAGRKIPQVVVAVDIFKEGTDVPAINIVMLLNDTNSSIEFMQSIGRGLRLAPFKTKLVVLDGIGLHRKMELFRHLADATIGERRSRIDGEGEGTRLVDGTPSVGIVFSGDVTEKFKKYRDNVPAHLIGAYHSYAAVPARERINLLDPWLAIQTGFMSEDAVGSQVVEGRNAFYAYLRELADQLVGGELTKDQKQEIRRKFLPALVEGFREADGLDVIISAEMAEQRVVYYRILELMNRERGEEEQVQPEMLDGIFPEFSGTERERNDHRARNLRFLRQAVFQKKYTDMMKWLAEEVQIDPESPEFLRQPETVQGVLRSFRMYLWDIRTNPDPKRSLNDMLFDIANAEKKVAGAAPSPEDEEGWIDDRTSRRQTSVNTQKAFIQIYLQHPLIAEHESPVSALSEADFDLPPEEFQGRLKALGLVVEVHTFKTFMNTLVKKVEEFTTAAKAKDVSALIRIRDELQNLLGSEANADYVSLDQISTQSAFDKFKDSFNKIAIILRKTMELMPSSEETSKSKKLGRRVLELWRMAAFGLTVPLEGFKGLGINVERNDAKGARYSIQLKGEHPALSAEGEERPAVEVHVREDLLGNKYLLLTDEEIWDLERLYAQEGLTDVQRLGILNSLTEALSAFREFMGPDLTYVFPSGRHGTFFADLMTHLLGQTDWNILGPFENIDPRGGEGTFDYRLRDMMASRVSHMTPDNVARMKSKRIGGAEKFPFTWQVRYVFDTLSVFQNDVLPVWEDDVLPKLEAFTSEDPKDEVMRDRLVQWMSDQISKDVTGPKRLGHLNNLMWILGRARPGTPLTPVQIQTAYAYAMVGLGQVFFNNRDYWIAVSGLFSVFGRVNLLEQRGSVVISSSLEEQIQRIFQSFLWAIASQEETIDFSKHYRARGAVDVEGGSFPSVEMMGEVAHALSLLELEVKKVAAAEAAAPVAASSTLRPHVVLATRNGKLAAHQFQGILMDEAEAKAFLRTLSLKGLTTEDDILKEPVLELDPAWRAELEARYGADKVAKIEDVLRHAGPGFTEVQLVVWRFFRNKPTKAKRDVVHRDPACPELAAQRRSKAGKVSLATARDATYRGKYELGTDICPVCRKIHGSTGSNRDALMALQQRLQDEGTAEAVVVDWDGNVVSSPEDAAMAPGGIDMNSRKMGMNIKGHLGKVFDNAQVADVRQGLVPVIVGMGTVPEFIVSNGR